MGYTQFAPGRREQKQLQPLAACAALACLLATSAAAAQPAPRSGLEALQLHLEGGGDIVLGGTPGDRFQPGGHLRGHLSLPLWQPLRAQLGTGSWWFPAEEGDTGRLISAELGLRLAPMATDQPSGLVVDANGGVGLTGDLERPVFSIGLGWDFPLGSAVALGPVVRYTHVLQPDSASGPDDARLLGVALVLTLSIPEGDPPKAADADKDGTPDKLDRCPGEAEDVDGYEDEDGCPDLGNDGDGVPDSRDTCPTTAGDGDSTGDGCPERAGPRAQQPEAPPPAPSEPAAEESGQKLEQVVRFNYRSHGILPGEEAAIQSVCDSVKSRAGARIRVTGHADEVGSAGFNHQLSARRAGNVARWLIRCGLSGDQIVVVGQGKHQPVCREATDECQAKNRRVEFELLE